MTQNQKNLEERINELENVRALRELVDHFSILADKKEGQKQSLLFTEEAIVETYVNGQLQGTLKGRNEIGNVFGGFINSLDALYHMNGQHVVSIKGNKAVGTLYCLVDLFSSEDGKKIKTTSGVSYKDEYVYENGQWLISKRSSNFVWQDKQELNQ